MQILFLTDFLKRYYIIIELSACMVSSFSARREDHFHRRFVQTDFPSEYLKLGRPRNTLFIFGRKNDRLFFVFVLFVCCNTLSDFGWLKKKTRWKTFFSKWSTKSACCSISCMVLVTYPRSWSFWEDLQPFKLQVYSKTKKIKFVPIITIILTKINL